MATNTWFVMIPPSYADKSTAEKELVDFVIQFQAGSQAWTDANAGKILSAAEGSTGNPQVGEQLVKWQGPFATQAQAKAAANPQQQSPNPVNDAVNAAENSSANPFNALSGLHFSWPGADTFLGRALKIVVGGVLLLAAIMKTTGAGQDVKALAQTVGKLP